MPTITFRTDSAIEEAIRELMEDGRDRSTVIREAILAARQARYDEHLRAQAEACASDPADLAEIRAIQAEMEELRAW